MAIDTLQTEAPGGGSGADAVPTATAGGRAVAGVRHGAIVLARHGEPALSRRVKLSSAGYREWWATYEEGGLLEGQVPPESLKAYARDAHAVFASTRPRAVQTARAAAGERPFIEDALFIEAPLPPPPWPLWLRMSPKGLGFFARFWWWFFDNHGGQETRKAAEARAGQAADLLIELADSGQDVLVLAHGFFNWMIGEALRKRGLTKLLDQGHRYWSIKRFRRG